MAKDAFESYEQNYIDLAVAERSLEDLRRETSELRAKVETMEQSFNRVQAAYNELSGQQEMLSDSHDELHYGLVMLGGFTHHPGISNYGSSSLQSYSSSTKSNVFKWRRHGHGRPYAFSWRRS